MEHEPQEPAPDRPDVSIVIPSFNEMRRLPQSLGRVFSFMEGTSWSWEAIVSDDGSQDGTPEMVARDFPWCRVASAERHLGKGAAVRRGMLAARGTMRLICDASLATPIEELTGMARILEAGEADIVIASRTLAESQPDVRQPWRREVARRILNRIVQPLSGLTLSDTQCGFKLFSAPAAEFLFARQTATGWAFDVEVLMLAEYFGYRIAERPAPWSDNEDSKAPLLKTAPRMAREILKFRWRRFTGKMAEEEGGGEEKS